MNKEDQMTIYAINVLASKKIECKRSLELTTYAPSRNNLELTIESCDYAINILSERFRNEEKEEQ